MEYVYGCFDGRCSKYWCAVLISDTEQAKPVCPSCGSTLRRIEYEEEVTLCEECPVLDSEFSTCNLDYEATWQSGYWDDRSRERLGAVSRNCGLEIIKYGNGKEYRPVKKMAVMFRRRR